MSRHSGHAQRWILPVVTLVALSGFGVAVACDSEASSMAEHAPSSTEDVTAAPVVPTAASPEAESQVEQTLNAWHRAAANANEEQYFAHFAPDAVFIGTDATERWTLSEFRDYAHPHFAAGRAWSMEPQRRAVTVAGDLAYFDEDLLSQGLGPLRGSGVLRRFADGWRITHYVLSFTIPNERVPAVRAALAEATPAVEDGSRTP